MLSTNVVMPNPMRPRGAGLAGLQPLPAVFAKAAGVTLLIPPPEGSLMVAIYVCSSPDE